MNVSFNFKDFLLYFKKISFKISFFVGISLYKFVLLNSQSTIINNIVNVIFILSIIFLLDDIIERIIKTVNKKNVLKKYIKELKNLSNSQIDILLAHYFKYNNKNLEVNQTSYFNIQEGEYQILKSKYIIFQAAKVATSFFLPFTLNEWAYNEIVRAIDNHEIYIEELKNDCTIIWYSKSVKCDKEIFNNRDYDYNNYM